MANYGLSVLDGDLKYTAPDGTVIDIAEAGSGVMYVNFTYDDSGGEDVYSADKTFAEVAAAIDAGKMIYGAYSVGGANFVYLPLTDYSEDYFATFRSFSLGNDGYFEQFTLTIAADDTVTGEYVHCDLSTLIVED